MIRPSTTQPGTPRRGLRTALAYVATSVLVATPLAIAATGSSAAALPLADEPSPTATAPAPAPADTPAPTTSPLPTDVPAPATTTAPTATVPAPSDPAVASASPTPSPASVTEVSGPGRVAVSHSVLARVPGTADTAAYLPLDTALSLAAPFDRIRVRYAVSNPGAEPVTFTPQLQLAVGGAEFADITADGPEAPLRMSTEWIPVDGGSAPGPGDEPIAPTDFRAGTDPAAGAVPGLRTAATNPGPALTLAPGERTEVEFSLRFGRTPAPLTDHVLRLTDAGAPVADAPSATVRTGAQDTVLSPDQLTGNATSPTTTTTTAPTTRTVFTASLSTTTSSPSSTSILGATGIRVALTGGGHGTGSPSSTECATCHSTHRSEGKALLVRPTMATSCLTCHDGTGSAGDVQSDYAIGQPANDPATASVWSHDALAGDSSHGIASGDEMAGVANRHAQCADCHNPHRADADPAATSAQVVVDGVSTGWSVPGALKGAPGLAVTQGAAGTAPAYTFLDGTLTAPTLEYQVCLTCHAGRTVLPAGLPGKPSTDSLDKGVELNPANPSFHPVTAAGTNQTPAMAASLAGSSPYKLWNFGTTDTVRCVSCHASSTASPSDPGAPLSPHASQNRGILLRPYKDRVLKGGSEAYAAADFALCLTCHAEAPFANAGGEASGQATNFRFHGLHSTEIAGEGHGGTEIDTAGAGQGNATCAECHFRLHSTTYAVPGQSVDGTRLVSFSPNVQPNTPSGQVIWTRDATGGGSCTLTCHGKVHDGETY